MCLAGLLRFCNAVSRSLLLVCALTSTACIEVLDEEESTIGELERDCVVPAPSDVEYGGVGHRYGIRGLTEEATLGLGVRLAIGTTEPLSP
jgi:hypothetical protein